MLAVFVGPESVNPGDYHQPFGPRVLIRRKVITVARFRYRKRTFLAPVSSQTTSYIWVQVESSDNGAYPLGTYMLTLADCHRSVELEFPLTSPQNRKQSLAKADLLLEVLAAFRDGLHAEAALIEKTAKRS